MSKKGHKKNGSIQYWNNKKTSVSEKINIMEPKSPAKTFQGPNEIFQRNYNVLLKKYPDIAKRIEEIGQCKDYILWKHEESGLHNVYSVKNDKFYYNGTNPEEDARVQVEQLKLKNTRVALFLGFGLGYEVAYFIKNMAAAQKTAAVIIIEKDLQLFMRAMEITDFSGLLADEKATFIIGKSEDELFLELKKCFDYSKNNTIYLKAIKSIYHPSAFLWENDYYMKALAKLKEVVVYCYAYLGNSPEDSLVGVRNMLYNINDILSNMGINRLYDKFKGKPAVVVSTGPSLNKNKHLLKGLEDKALIIAADSALKILLADDIKPHMVTMLERDYVMSGLVEGLPKEKVDEVYFAACPVIDKRSYEVYPGPRIIVYRNFDHFKWLGVDRGILDIKHSAGNMSFKIAEALGCNPIILIGQDLSYGEEGHTHAKGMAFGHDRQEEKQFKSMLVPGNNGGMVETHEIWYQFLKSYEIDIEGYKGTCINSTEGGAYIKGTVVIPFSEAIDKYIKEAYNPLEIVKLYEKEFMESKTAKSYEFSKVSKLVDDTIEDMQHVVDTCKEGRKLCSENADTIKEFITKNPAVEKELIDRYSEIQNDVYSLKAKAKERRDTFQLFFMHVVQSYYVKFEVDMIELYGKYDSEAVASAVILLNHERWFVTVGELAQICLDLLHETKEKLDSRISEEV